MHKDYFVEMLTGNPPLFQAILSFNGLLDTQPCPLPLCFEDSLECEDSLVIKALWPTPALRRRYPQQTNTAIPPPFWDFSEESRRLALLPTAVLKHLGNTFGAALHGEAIALTLLRHDVIALKQGLGEALYNSVLQRGRYQAGRSMRKFFITRNQELPLPEKVHLHGLLALEVCCSTWPETLRTHAVSHLGDALPFLNVRKDPETVRHEDMPPADIIWLNLKKLLLKEVAPQWAHYFN